MTGCFFPIATHYSGNTAHKISEVFNKYFRENKLETDFDKKIYKLYKNTYNLDRDTLKNFTSPMNILDFYNQETLWELKSLGVSGDYDYSYTTGHKDFFSYINVIIDSYKNNNLLTLNDKNELAINYEKFEWKNNTKTQIKNINFIQDFHKNNVLSAMKNIRNDWSLLRNNGYGVNYKVKGIVDPMFDSELFMIFDLYIKFKKDFPIKEDQVGTTFENLFNVLKGIEKPKNELVNNIVKWLPCDYCICEEHLKNWLVKKFYAETELLNEEYRTKNFFILGMGLLNGLRMSASRGTAILSNDLINTYGGINSRIIMIFSGGHPSKEFEYDINTPSEIEKILKKFSSYYTYLILCSQNNLNDDILCNNITIESIEKNIKINIDKGYFKQALIELLVIIPKKISLPNKKLSSDLLILYKMYLDILVPGLINNFHNIK